MSLSCLLDTHTELWSKPLAVGGRHGSRPYEDGIDTLRGDEVTGGANQWVSSPRALPGEELAEEMEGARGHVGGVDGHP